MNRAIYYFARWLYRYGARQLAKHEREVHPNSTWTPLGFEEINQQRRLAYCDLARAILFNGQRQFHGIDKFLAPGAWYLR